MTRIILECDKAAVDTMLDGLDLLPHGRVRRLYDAVLGAARAQLEQAQQAAQQVGQTEEPAPPQRRLRAARVKRKE